MSSSVQRSEVDVCWMRVLDHCSSVRRSAHRRVHFVASDEVAWRAQTSAIVVFEQAEGRANVLSAAAAGATVDYEVPEPDRPYGVKAWLLEHQAQFPGNKVLGAQLDEWVRSVSSLD